MRSYRHPRREPLDPVEQPMNSWRRLAVCALTVLTAALSPVGAATPENVAYVTNQGDGVTVIDLATMKTRQTLAVGKDPRGLGITPDGRTLVTANQADEDVSVVDTATGKTIHRIAVGKNAEFVRVSPNGRFAYVTYEPSSSGKPPGKDESAGKSGKATQEQAAEPAEIAVIDLSKFEVSARLPASPETEGMEFSPDGRELVVANEGDDTVVVYQLESGRAIKKIDISPYGKRPRGVKVSPDGSRFLVTLESSDNVLVLDSSTLAPIASIPVGKRCWHFSFTPDGQRVLVACGRSNALTVIDVAKRQAVSTLTGFDQPWGIVTYPKASGSLDAPPPAGAR